MKKIFQTTHGEQGNCFAACMASLFEEDLEKWECTANHREDWREQTQRLLQEKGLQHNEISLTQEDGQIFNGKYLYYKNVSLKNGNLYLLGVTSKNNLPHVVIGRFNQEITNENKNLSFIIEHDPLGISNEEIIQISSIILFSKSFQ